MPRQNFLPDCFVPETRNSLTVHQFLKTLKSGLDEASWWGHETDTMKLWQLRRVLGHGPCLLLPLTTLAHRREIRASVVASSFQRRGSSRRSKTLKQLSSDVKQWRNSSLRLSSAAARRNQGKQSLSLREPELWSSGSPA